MGLQYAVLICAELFFVLPTLPQGLSHIIYMENFTTPAEHIGSAYKPLFEGLVYKPIYFPGQFILRLDSKPVITDKAKMVLSSHPT